MHRLAAIDIGTNSVLLLIAERSEHTGQVVAVVERATVTRLGEGVDRSGALAPAACERTLACLQRYAEEIRSHGVGQVRAVGTSALRDATGGEAFLDAAEAVLGVRPEVISGEREAELTFAGSLSGLDVSGSVLVFDVGGGSTEFISGSVLDGTPTLERGVSLDIGSVRLFERHITTDPPSLLELERVRADIRAALSALERPTAQHRLVGVAGTVTTLAALQLELATYDADQLHGARLNAEVLHALRDRLIQLPLQQRQGLAGMEPKRADVIVVGALLVTEVIAWSGAAELTVSARGVRWGLLQ